MKSEERLVDHPLPETIGNAKPGSRRRGRYGVLMGSVLCAVVLCLVASGCLMTTAHAPAGSKKSCSGGSCPLKRSKPLFGSLFQKEEPGPPESPQEWLALEPLRP